MVVSPLPSQTMQHSLSETSIRLQMRGQERTHRPRLFSVSRVLVSSHQFHSRRRSRCINVRMSCSACTRGKSSQASWCSTAKGRNNDAECHPVFSRIEQWAAEKAACSNRYASC